MQQLALESQRQHEPAHTSRQPAAQIVRLHQPTAHHAILHSCWRSSMDSPPPTLYPAPCRRPSPRSSFVPLFDTVRPPPPRRVPASSAELIFAACTWNSCTAACENVYAAPAASTTSPAHHLRYARVAARVGLFLGLRTPRPPPPPVPHRHPQKCWSFRNPIDSGCCSAVVPRSRRKLTAPALVSAAIGHARHQQRSPAACQSSGSVSSSLPPYTRSSPLPTSSAACAFTVTVDSTCPTAPAAHQASAVAPSSTVAASTTTSNPGAVIVTMPSPRAPTRTAKKAPSAPLLSTFATPSPHSTTRPSPQERRRRARPGRGRRSLHRPRLPPRDAPSRPPTPATRPGAARSQPCCNARSSCTLHRNAVSSRTGRRARYAETKKHEDIAAHANPGARRRKLKSTQSLGAEERKR